MEEITTRFIKYFPQYLNEFGSILSGPKRFMAKRELHTSRLFYNSLHFLVLSLFVTVVARAPLLLPEDNLWIFLGSQAILCLMSVVLFAASLRLSWRIVGGKATFRSFFVAYAYFYGVIFVMTICVFLIAEGTFKFLEPELYIEVRNAIINNTKQPTIHSSVIYIPLVILTVGYVALSVWYIVAWGAYRQLNQLSKRHSVAAFLISVPFNALAFGAVFFASSALA